MRRYKRLLDKWLDEQEEVAKRAALVQKKIKQYRDKVRYYEGRVNELDDEDIGRALRSIDLRSTANDS